MFSISLLFPFGPYSINESLNQHSFDCTFNFNTHSLDQVVCFPPFLELTPLTPTGGFFNKTIIPTLVVSWGKFVYVMGNNLVPCPIPKDWDTGTH